MRKSVLALVVALLPLIALTPAEAGVSLNAQGAYVLVFAENATTIKNVNQKFAFVWFPMAANGAENGYALEFNCIRANANFETAGKGKVTVSKVELVGMDSGDTMSLGKKAAKFKQGATGFVTISRADFSGFAGESGVLVTGNLKATKKLTAAECKITMTEFLGDPP